jgi:hypothetical protein
MLSIPLPRPCQSNERVNGPLCKDRPRKTIDRFHPAGLWRWRRLVLAHGSNRHVVVLGRTLCMKEKACFSAFSAWNWRVQHFDLPHVAVAWQELPAALNLTRVQVSFYLAVIRSMDYRSSLYICSSRLVFFSQLRLPWFAFMFWVAMEQELSDGWGCTVRNQDNGPEPRRIRITSHIYTAMR